MHNSYHFAEHISRMTDTQILHPQNDPGLEIECHSHAGKELRLTFAPFDHVNVKARIVIVGLTPGQQQASNALRAARDALRAGKSPEAAWAEAKVHASFSGPMRASLCRMLDAIGIPQRLGIATSEELWTSASDLAHFTSIIRYPLFVDGQNWSGSPSPLRVPIIQNWLTAYSAKRWRTSREHCWCP